MHPWGSNGIMGRNANPRPPPILPLSAWRRSRDAESLGELEPPDLAIGEMHAGMEVQRRGRSISVDDLMPALPLQRTISAPVSPATTITSPGLQALTPPSTAASWRSKFVLSAHRASPKLEPIGAGRDAHILRLVNESCAALDAGCRPSLVDDGLGGTYIIESPWGSRLPISLFKPRDEEPCGPNNPKGAQQTFIANIGEEGMCPGIRIGDAALNEHLAYTLDATERSRHFCRVPATACVRTEHTSFFDASTGEGASYGEAQASPFRARKDKAGSLQRYVPHDGPADDFSHSLFPTLEVQRIACLDLWLLNADRHGGNILVQRTSTAAADALTPTASSCCGSQLPMPALSLGETAAHRSIVPRGAVMRLVPIDHGFCLPTSLRSVVPNLEWRHWPQARAPLAPEVQEHIARIDADADAALLASRRESGVSDGSIRTLRVGTALLQQGAAAGLSLGEMADIVLVREAEAEADRRIAWECGGATFPREAASGGSGKAVLRCERRGQKRPSTEEAAAAAQREAAFLDCYKARLACYLRGSRSAGGPWLVLLVWGATWLPRERPNSSTSSDEGASKSAFGGYRGAA
ncbi:hypothetical protein EMIHUDRAFT_450026 [Emiliania huxleyi CCMP1516]|uniref:PI3K/PI4K catalytic domain-containing protein n=2 Tax=Emiliania huxleyi TaxID=2903 RepID=A0A0D3JYG5_EMIH1|nr:hypothetical protein EMIHUDRAFT_450026 [Emiliania huxleyi CCMP1516]EOD28550.1 hypothetical protein EMIHUDRAFT_450026 [Emiliania huxleyi CCMP1516]|eukprot:XP_005780979.1 hypothetical protein EMIHUDRAFT_450026 [Emiliania huxleyi CCMP1516]